MSDLPFDQQLVISVAGPAVAALLGTGLLGYVLSRIATRYQASREDRVLRDGLIDAMTRTAGGMYTALQSYARFRENLAATATDEAATARRSQLDSAYETLTTDRDVLEARLAAYFDRSVWLLFHGAWDCLTVRYYKAIATSQDSPNMLALYRTNEGAGHTGLSIEDMTPAIDETHQILRTHYLSLIRQATNAVARAEMAGPTKANLHLARASTP